MDEDFIIRVKNRRNLIACILAASLVASVVFNGIVFILISIPIAILGVGAFDSQLKEQIHRNVDVDDDKRALLASIALSSFSLTITLSSLIYLSIKVLLESSIDSSTLKTALLTFVFLLITLLSDYLIDVPITKTIERVIYGDYVSEEELTSRKIEVLIESLKTTSSHSREHKQLSKLTSSLDSLIYSIESIKRITNEKYRCKVEKSTLMLLEVRETSILNSEKLLSTYEGIELITIAGKSNKLISIYSSLNEDIENLASLALEVEVGELTYDFTRRIDGIKYTLNYDVANMGINEKEDIDVKHLANEIRLSVNSLVDISEAYRTSHRGKIIVTNVNRAIHELDNTDNPITIKALSELFNYANSGIRQIEYFIQENDGKLTTKESMIADEDLLNFEEFTKLLAEAVSYINEETVNTVERVEKQMRRSEASNLYDFI